MIEIASWARHVHCFRSIKSNNSLLRDYLLKPKARRGRETVPRSSSINTRDGEFTSRLYDASCVCPMHIPCCQQDRPSTKWCRLNKLSQYKISLPLREGLIQQQGSSGMLNAAQKHTPFDGYQGLRQPALCLVVCKLSTRFSFALELQKSETTCCLCRSLG